MEATRLTKLTKAMAKAMVRADRVGDAEEEAMAMETETVEEMEGAETPLANPQGTLLEPMEATRIEQTNTATRTRARTQAPQAKGAAAATPAPLATPTNTKVPKPLTTATETNDREQVRETKEG